MLTLFWHPEPNRRITPGLSGRETALLEIGVFHNGASSLPVITTKDGVRLNDGTLRRCIGRRNRRW